MTSFSGERPTSEQPPPDEIGLSGMFTFRAPLVEQQYALALLSLLYTSLRT